MTWNQRLVVARATAKRLMVEEVSRGLQLQSLWRVPTESRPTAATPVESPYCAAVG